MLGTVAGAARASGRELKQQEFLRSAARVALSSYVANGLVAAAGLLAISTLVHVLVGPLAAAAATVGVIVVTLVITTAASLYKTRVHDVKKEADENALDSA